MRTMLVLGGGNALGAFHGGVFEAMHERGLEPDVIAGSSIGAVVGAIIAGNPPERRLTRLRDFWRQAGAGTSRWTPESRRWRALHQRTQELHSFVFGRPGLFQPRVPGLLSMLPGMPDDVAILDHAPTARTLERLIDFDVLNRAVIPLLVTTVDVETGEQRVFDTREEVLTPAHFLATTALAPAFPPVEIDGRLLVDPAAVANLPLDRVPGEAAAGDLLCLAVDLFAADGPRPRSLELAADRMRDIGLAAQSQRALDRLVADARCRTLERRTAEPALRLVTMRYRAPRGLPARPFDFSASSCEERWSAGHAVLLAALARLDAPPDVKVGSLAVYQTSRGAEDAALPLS